MLYMVFKNIFRKKTRFALSGITLSDDLPLITSNFTSPLLIYSVMSCQTGDNPCQRA